MKIITLGIILGLIALIPNGIWISIGILLIWIVYNLKDIRIVGIEIVNQMNQNEYDSEILEEMK